MKNFVLVAISLVSSLISVALGVAPAKAANPPDIGLNFDLAPATPKVSGAIASGNSELSTASTPKPLALPAQAASVPLGSDHKTGVVAELPPPPSLEAAQPIEPSHSPQRLQPSATIALPPTAAPDSTASTVDAADTANTADTADAAAQPPELRFDSEEVTASSSTNPSVNPSTHSSQSDSSQEEQPAPHAPAPIAPVETAPSMSSDLRALFHGDENSLVARAVGSAEGTRTAEGGRTWAYEGHVDPGNGAWNRGTFSYQHQADSPEDADRKQLQRLMSQAQTLRQGAESQGLQLSLEEELNGIDLANQSPRAALSRGGYVDRLKQARDMGLQGSDAVLWARTRAFLDPDTSRWNAPGLGNNVNSITADQERRRKAIERAIALNALPSDSAAQIAAAPAETAPAQQTAMLPPPRREDKTDAEAIANQIISLDLPPT